MSIIIVAVLVRMVNIVLDTNYNFLKPKMLSFAIKHGYSVHAYNKWTLSAKGFSFYEEKFPSIELCYYRLDINCFFPKVLLFLRFWIFSVAIIVVFVIAFICCVLF